MDLLRIATAGSVDDGKSTLIGRLLVETGSVPRDRLDAIAEASRRRRLDFDLSLLTDGLIAERAQGITIDVAHVYFATAARKYIIADVPGHVEYTRNMVTGASTAAVALVLLDATKGPVEQTCRHLFIAALLRLPAVVICINKMDLVAWSEARFSAIAAEVATLVSRLSLPAAVHLVPMSSLHGDNVVARSERMPWYGGPPLLERLEAIEPAAADRRPLRLPVQCLLRSVEDGAPSRRYAGRLASGRVRVGDDVVVLPGRQRTRVTAIERAGEAVASAVAGDSVSVSLADQIDVDRGSLLAGHGQAPAARTNVLARLCWLDEVPAVVGRTYTVQHGVRRVRARFTEIAGVIDPQTLRLDTGVEALKLNDIAVARLRLGEPIFADDHAANPANGTFIVIDDRTHHTAAVGFVESGEEPRQPALRAVSTRSRRG